MEDLKKLALELLEIEKRYLREDKDEYLSAVVVVVTSEGRYVEEPEFSDEASKVTVYSSIVARAKEKKARAIVTINTVRYKTIDSDEGLTGYQWGNLQDQGYPRAINVTISGPGLDSVLCSLPFGVVNEELHMGELSAFEKADVGMLPDWP